MTETVVVLAVIAALAAGYFVGSRGRRRSDVTSVPSNTGGNEPALIAHRRESGALLPVSLLRPLPDLSLVQLEQVSAVGERAALVIELRDDLGAELQTARSSGALNLVKGPAAAALASLLNNERIVDTMLGKAGYYVVTASPAAKWMSANGRNVAQEVGKHGAGARAVVVGGATFALAPEVAAVALAATAEYILTAKIERMGKVVDLVHHRQLAEALSAADQVLQLIGRLREYDDPRDWPEVVMSPLVSAHLALGRQTFAADRLREVILGNDPEGTKQPSDPRTGDKSSARDELAAGYELHAVAAQAAAARLVHAQAHGDDITAAELEWQLGEHISQLRKHHLAIDAISNLKSRAFRSGWGKRLGGLRTTYRAVIGLAETHEYSFVLVLNGSEPELLALPPGPVSTSIADVVDDDVEQPVSD